MAGGHHGGGGHFGGHHGGGFGGGFRGGSGGFRGGGFGGDSGRDELGYAEWDSGNYPQGSFAYFAVEIGSLLIMFIISCIVHFYHVPGFNLLNSVMFIVATILFIIAFSSDGNTGEIKNFKGKSVPSGSGNIYRAWEGMRPNDSYGTETTWASHKGNYYSISFFEKEFRDSNLKQVYETVQRTPSIVWLSSKVWIFIAIICLISNLFFYEMVIPVFEKATMTDEAFAFMDEFVFYFPAGLAIVSGIICLAIRKNRHKILHECAMRIAEDNFAAGVRIKTIGVIEDKMSSKWFYDECPNCGSIAPTDATACPFCGSSLEALDPEAENIHRLSKINVKG